MKISRKSGKLLTEASLAKPSADKGLQRSRRDWSKISLPTDEAFQNLCKTHGILGENQDKLEELIRDLGLLIRTMLESQNEEGLISEHRQDAESQLTRIQSVLEWLKTYDWQLAYQERPGREFRYGIRTRRALSQAAMVELSPLIDPWFMANRVGAVPEGVSAVPKVESAVFSYESRNSFIKNFVQHNPEKRLIETVSAVEATLKHFIAEMRNITPMGGPRPAEIEPHVVLNLAIIYAALGNQPTSTYEGRFHSFAQDVMEALGLPANWVASYLREAITAWKALREKSGVKIS